VAAVLNADSAEEDIEVVAVEADLERKGISVAEAVVVAEADSVEDLQMGIATNTETSREMVTLTKIATVTEKVTQMEITTPSQTDAETVLLMDTEMIPQTVSVADLEIIVEATDSVLKTAILNGKSIRFVNLYINVFENSFKDIYLLDSPPKRL
jgi:hypothetical protein